MALTIDGSDPSGDLGDLLDAKLPIAGGKILQVVRATDTTRRTTTSTSLSDSNLSVTITPSKSDSNLILIATVYWYLTTLSGELQITDSANTSISGAQGIGIGSDGTVNQYGLATPIAWASPGTISAVTYKLRFRKITSGTLALENAITTAQMFAIEVSA